MRRRRFDLSSADRQRRELPYGVWTLADGGQVLFDRDYFPIWQRSPDAGVAAIRVAAWRWVDWTQQNHFFDDDNAPFHDDATKKTCARILADFITGKPIDQYWRAHEARRRASDTPIAADWIHTLAKQVLALSANDIARAVEILREFTDMSFDGAFLAIDAVAAIDEAPPRNAASRIKDSEPL